MNTSSIHRCIAVGFSTFTLALIAGASLGPACTINNYSNPDHCQNTDGDRFCRRKYPDEKEKRWFCESEPCQIRNHPNNTDGCIAEIVLEEKDECYRPCGWDVPWEECNDPLLAESTEGPDTSTDTSTSDDTTTGSESDVGSESGSETISEGICGDGVQDGGEECDDGNKENDDACTNFCTTAVCGDKMIQLDEECDDGNQSNEDGCLNNCKYASCGDGEVRVDMEECDDGNTMDGDGCSAACRKECGDGTWNADNEDCDDGNQDNDDGCSANCEDERKVVFVTSMPTPSGNMGGILGADGICQTAADNANLQGTFRAWLSSGGDMGSSPSTSWTNKRSLPYVRVDGEEVAMDWEDLVDGSDLLNPINVTENNMPVGNNIFVWTNTSPQGTSKEPANDCKSWTNGELEVGGQGLSSQTNTTWTQMKMPDIVSCSVADHHLYCFEQ